MESIVLLLTVADEAMLVMAVAKPVYSNICYSLPHFDSSCISSYATHLEPYISR